MECIKKVNNMSVIRMFFFSVILFSNLLRNGFFQTQIFSIYTRPQQIHNTHLPQPLGSVTQKNNKDNTMPSWISPFTRDTYICLGYIAWICSGLVSSLLCDDHSQRHSKMLMTGARQDAKSRARALFCTLVARRASRLSCGQQKNKKIKA